MGGDKKFSDLRIPFACVATDIHTCEEVVINEGSVLEGIRASISIPAVFTVARWGDMYMVDGSLVNPVPVSALKEMGADFIIAVNVIPDKSEITQKANSERDTDCDTVNPATSWGLSARISSSSTRWIG